MIQFYLILHQAEIQGGQDTDLGYSLTLSFIKERQREGRIQIYDTVLLISSSSRDTGRVGYRFRIHFYFILHQTEIQGAQDTVSFRIQFNCNNYVTLSFIMQRCREGRIQLVSEYSLTLSFIRQRYKEGRIHIQDTVKLYPSSCRDTGRVGYSQFQNTV